MSDTNVAGNIIQILASLPEFLRKPMLKNRLSEFFALPKDEQTEIVTNALNAVPLIDFKVLSNLFRTWLEVLCEFAEDKRQLMFGTYVDVLVPSPSLISQLNVEGLTSIFNNLLDEKKEILLNSLANVLKELPDGKKRTLYEAIPNTAKEVLNL